MITTPHNSNQNTANGGHPPNVITATDADFQEKAFGHDGFVLVDFWAAWCGPCLMLAPEIDELAKELGDQLRVVKLNVDENPQTSAKFQVFSIPALLLITTEKNAEGKRKAVMTAGFRPKEALLKWMKQYGFVPETNKDTELPKAA